MIFWASPDSSHHTKAVAIFSPVVTNVLDLPLPPGTCSAAPLVFGERAPAYDHLQGWGRGVCTGMWLYVYVHVGTLFLRH